MTLSPTNTAIACNGGVSKGGPTTIPTPKNAHFLNYTLDSKDPHHSSHISKQSYHHAHNNHNHSHGSTSSTTHHNKSSTRIIIIPTLDDLIKGHHIDNDYYSQSAFMSYLESIHCVENYQFVIDINNLITNHSQLTIEQWQAFFNQFLNMNSSQEINIGCDLKSKFSYFDIPNIRLLITCKKIIIDEILLNLFNEFIKVQNHHIKSLNQTGEQVVVYRRKSELVSPIDHQDVVEGEEADDEQVSYLSSHIDSKLFISKSTIKQIELNDIDDNSSSSTASSSDNDSCMMASRNNSSSSTTTTASMRGSSIGSIIDSIEKFKKVKKQFKFRRFSNEE